MTMHHSFSNDHNAITTDLPTTTRAKPHTMAANYYALRHSLPSERSGDMLGHDAPDMRRYSAPSSSSLWPSAVVVPESILMATDVRIAGVAQRGDHCVYLLEVESSAFGAHVLDKRYSEIREFRAQLFKFNAETKTHCGPCAQLAKLAQLKFPWRRLQLPSLTGKREANFDVAQERVPQLERFLQAMLRVYRMVTRREMRACNNAKCGALELIKRFLDVDEPALSDQEETAAVSYCGDATAAAHHEMSVDYKMPQGLAPVYGPRSLPGSLRGSVHSAPLYSIEEQPESAAAQ